MGDFKLFYKRRVSALIDRNGDVSMMAKRIGESQRMTQHVFFGSKRSLRIEEKISRYLGGELEYFFDCETVKRRRVS